MSDIFTVLLCLLYTFTNSSCSSRPLHYGLTLFSYWFPIWVQYSPFIIPWTNSLSTYSICITLNTAAKPACTILHRYILGYPCLYQPHTRSPSFGTLRGCTWYHTEGKSTGFLPLSPGRHDNRKSDPQWLHPPPSGNFNCSKCKGLDPIFLGFVGVSLCWILYHPCLTCLSAFTFSRCTIPPWISPAVPPGYPVPSTYSGVQVRSRIRNQAGGIWNVPTFFRSHQIYSRIWIPTGGSGSATWCRKPSISWRPPHRWYLVRSIFLPHKDTHNRLSLSLFKYSSS